MGEQQTTPADFDFVRFFTNNPLYLSVAQLEARGWTERLVRSFLGSPDRWGPVDHWKCWKGKRLYYLGRVEVVEGLPDFQKMFDISVRRRGLEPPKIRGFLEERRKTEGLADEIHSAMTPEERQYVVRVERVANLFAHCTSRALPLPPPRGQG